MQRACDSVDVVDADVSLAALDSADVGAVESDRVGEGFLRVAREFSELPNALTEFFAVLKLLVARVCHLSTFCE